MAWYDADGRVVTDRVRRLSAFVEERKRERRARERAAPADRRAPWQLTDADMVRAVRRRFEKEVGGDARGAVGGGPRRWS